MNLSNSALMGINTQTSAADGKPTDSGKKAGPAFLAGSEKNAENFRRTLAHASNRGQARQRPSQGSSQESSQGSRRTPEHQTSPSAQQGTQKNDAPAAGAENSGRGKAQAILTSGSGGGSRAPAEAGSESERFATEALRQILASLGAEGSAAETAESKKALAGWLNDLTEPSDESTIAAELQQLLALINGGEKAAEASFGFLGGKSKEGLAAGISTGGSRQAGLSALLAQLQQLLASDQAAGEAAGQTAAADAESGKALQDILDQLRQRLMKDPQQNAHAQKTAKTDTDQDLQAQLRQIFENREKASLQGRHAAAAETEKAAGRDLQAQLKQLFRQAETGQAETGQARGGQGKDVQAAASLANAAEGRRSSETGWQSSLRQLLNDLADKAGAEEKGAGNGKAKEALTDLKFGLKNTDANKVDAEQLLRSLNAEKAGAKPSVSVETGAKTAELTGQTQAGSQGNEKAGTAAAPARHAAASFDRALQSAENRVVSQVFVRLFSGARQGSGNMTINMHPPELGSVKVRIVSDSGHLNVSLHPQNHQVVGILERHLPTLQQSLADQGIDIADLQVSVDSGGEEEKPQFEEQAFDGRQHRAAQRESADAEAEAEALVEDPQAVGSGSESGLSLRV